MKLNTIVFLFLQILLPAQTTKPGASLTSAGYSNGRTWQTYSAPQKLLYVTANFEATAFEMNDGSSLEMVQRLDRLYLTGGNRGIPIARAIRILRTARKGPISEMMFREELETTRRIWSK